MAAIAGFNNFVGGFSLDSDFAIRQVETIRRAFQQNLFAPYKIALVSEAGYCTQTTWIERMENSAQSKIEGSCSETELFLSYLFVLIIDPNIKEDEKRGVLDKSRPRLTPKEQEDFCLGLINAPPVISTHILRYSSLDVWELAIRQVEDVTCYISLPDILKGTGWGVKWTDCIIIKWVKEIVSNNWTPVEKQVFLDSFAMYLSSIIGEGSFLLLCVDPHLQQQFSLIASASLSQQLEGLKHETSVFLESSLTAGERVRISFTGKQRIYFLQLFCQKALSHPQGFLIASDFSDDDWKWLKTKLTPARLSVLTMDWMIANARYVSKLPPDHPNFLGCFIAYAPNIIDEAIDQDRWLQLAEALALTPKYLAYCYTLLTGECRKHILSYLLLEKPQTFLKWVCLLLVDVGKDEIRSQIRCLMWDLSRFDLLTQGFSILFSEEGGLDASWREYLEREAK